jgi:membrane associated rhomboid family serine protease
VEENEEKAFNAPPASLYTAASLIILHIMLTVADKATVEWLYGTMAFSTGRFASFLADPSLNGSIKTLLNLSSHLFLHADFMHLLTNAFMLLAFGALVERAKGKFAFFFVFFLCGWLGAVGEYLTTAADASTYLIGASGAVFGMMGASVWLLLPKFGPKKIIAFIGVMMGLNLVIGLTPLGTLLAGEGNSISWAAHLAGFVGGLLILPLLGRASAKQE